MRPTLKIQGEAERAAPFRPKVQEWSTWSKCAKPTRKGEPEGFRDVGSWTMKEGPDRDGQAPLSSRPVDTEPLETKWWSSFVWV